MIVRFIAKRFGQGIFVIFLLSTLSFAIINAAPGDPATALYGPLAERLTFSERARINRNYGADKPVLERYIKWGSQLLKGDLGISYSEGRKVSTILKERIPNTLILSLSSIGLILILTVFLGLKAGFNEGSIWDKFINALGITFYSIPHFWLALIFIMIFSVKFRIFPSSGIKSVSGGGDILDIINHLILPVSVTVIAHVGAYARFIQEKVKLELNSSYVMAAMANGMEDKKLVRGVVKNALVPFVNYLGIVIPSFFGGSVMIETVFSWPGLGMLSVKAANTKDYPLLMGTIFVTGIIVIISIMITDIIQISLNPSLRKQVM